MHVAVNCIVRYKKYRSFRNINSVIYCHLLSFRTFKLLNYIYIISTFPYLCRGGSISAWCRFSEEYNASPHSKLGHWYVDVMFLGKTLCPRARASLLSGVSEHLVGQRLLCVRQVSSATWLQGCMLPSDWKWYMDESVQWPGIIWCKGPQATYVRHINRHIIIIFKYSISSQSGINAI